MTRLVLLVVLMWGVSACGKRGQTAARQSQDTVDTATIPPAPPPQPAASVAAADAPAYIIHGVCPFECCKYGDWTLLQGGPLRSDPSDSAETLALIASGASVHTDSGVMVLEPPGLAVVTGGDTSAAASASGAPQAGDTVELLSYTDQKSAHVRWQGQEFERAGRAGLQILREPVQRWWVYLNDAKSGQAGWMQMSGVNAEEVGGRNCTTQAKPKS